MPVIGMRDYVNNGHLLVGILDHYSPHFAAQQEVNSEVHQLAVGGEISPIFIAEALRRLRSCTRSRRRECARA